MHSEFLDHIDFFMVQPPPTDQLTFLITKVITARSSTTKLVWSIANF